MYFLLLREYSGFRRQVEIHVKMIDSDLFLSPPASYYSICTSGPRLGTLGSKNRRFLGRLKYSGFSELPVLE